MREFSAALSRAFSSFRTFRRANSFHRTLGAEVSRGVAAATSSKSLSTQMQNASQPRKLFPVEKRSSRKPANAATVAACRTGRIADFIEGNVRTGATATVKGGALANFAIRQKCPRATGYQRRFCNPCNRRRVEK
jgi:hypothetical protein